MCSTWRRACLQKWIFRELDSSSWEALLPPVPNPEEERLVVAEEVQLTVAVGVAAVVLRWRVCKGSNGNRIHRNSSFGLSSSTSTCTSIGVPVVQYHSACAGSNATNILTGSKSPSHPHTLLMGVLALAGCFFPIALQKGQTKEINTQTTKMNQTTKMESYDKCP